MTVIRPVLIPHVDTAVLKEFYPNCDDTKHAFALLKLFGESEHPFASNACRMLQLGLLVKTDNMSAAQFGRDCTVQHAIKSDGSMMMLFMVGTLFEWFESMIRTNKINYPAIELGNKTYEFLISNQYIGPVFSKFFTVINYPKYFTLQLVGT